MSNQNSNENGNKQQKNLRGVLVNLDLAVAETFYGLARTGKFFNKKSPTAVARELILEFVERHSQRQQEEQPVDEQPEVA